MDGLIRGKSYPASAVVFSERELEEWIALSSYDTGGRHIDDVKQEIVDMMAERLEKFQRPVVIRPEVLKGGNPVVRVELRSTNSGFIYGVETGRNDGTGRVVAHLPVTPPF